MYLLFCLCFLLFLHIGYWAIKDDQFISQHQEMQQPNKKHLKSQNIDDIVLFYIDQPCSTRALHSHYDPSQLKNVIPFIFSMRHSNALCSSSRVNMLESVQAINWLTLSKNGGRGRGFRTLWSGLSAWGMCSWQLHVQWLSDLSMYMGPSLAFLGPFFSLKVSWGKAKGIC